MNTQMAITMRKKILVRNKQERTLKVLGLIHTFSFYRLISYKNRLWVMKSQSLSSNSGKFLEILRDWVKLYGPYFL